MCGQREGPDPGRQSQIRKGSEPEMCWFLHSSSILIHKTHTHTRIQNVPLPQSWADDSSAAGTTPPSVQSAHHLHTLQFQPPHAHTNTLKFSTVQPHTGIESLSYSVSLYLPVSLLSLSLLFSFTVFFTLTTTLSPCQCNCIPPIKRDTMDAPAPPTLALLEVGHVETLFHIPHQVNNK